MMFYGLHTYDSCHAFACWCQTPQRIWTVCVCVCVNGKMEKCTPPSKLQWKLSSNCHKNAITLFCVALLLLPVVVAVVVVVFSYEYDKFLRCCHNNKPELRLRRCFGMWKARGKWRTWKNLIKILTGCETFMANYAPSGPTKTKRSKKKNYIYIYMYVCALECMKAAGKAWKCQRALAKKYMGKGCRGSCSANVKSAEIAQVQLYKRRGRQSDAEATDVAPMPTDPHTQRPTGSCLQSLTDDGHGWWLQLMLRLIFLFATV